MKKMTIDRALAGQRLDRILSRFLTGAPKSFIYRMLRKKNITLNGKKAAGNEKVQEGDTICLFFSDETLERLTGQNKGNAIGVPAEKLREMAEAFERLIVYEDDQVLFVNKPAGMLTQKAQNDDLSLCEYLLACLYERGEVSESSLETFRPAPCNRLDRNTSGLAVCGKTTQALQELSALLHDRTASKFYQCLVWGKMKESGELSDYLSKDRTHNQVEIHHAPSRGGTHILTRYRPLRIFPERNLTLLEVELVTGKTHQIRAHLAAGGHPIAGDPKYGDPDLNNIISEQCHVRRQLLHAARFVFPEMTGTLSYLSGKSIQAPLPGDFEKVLTDYCGCGKD